MTSDQIINAAVGYYNLGMTEDALTELDHLPPAERKRPEALALYTAIQMKLKRWEDAMLSALDLARTAPTEAAPYLDVAFCLHELKRTQDARQVLLDGPDCLKDIATYHYNLACYEAQLRNLNQSKRHLDRAIELDPDFDKNWKQDPDLRPLLQNVI